MRTGLWFSGAGGSGILVARLPDGSWSPPSGLMLHTAGLGFLVGVDIYDCVMVINTDEAMQGFSKIRATVGGEMSAVAGPVGIGGVMDSEVHKRRAPIFTYLKSRGFYAGVQIDGTVLIERTDENERFYGEKLPVTDILAGKVRHTPYELRTLMQTLKAAQGDAVDDSELPSGQSPSDYEIDDGRLFGVPDKMDPDPYGVLVSRASASYLDTANIFRPSKRKDSRSARQALITVPLTSRSYSIRALQARFSTSTGIVLTE
jgi:lipid-binding SYLF domain-containing protein